jgi:hypothetical protein
MPPTPRPAKRPNPAGSSQVSAGFSFGGVDGKLPRGVAMLTAERCRDRAAECQQMAEDAPNGRMRDILLDVARTWTRLAFEAEQWTQMNRPSARSSASPAALRQSPRPKLAGVPADEVALRVLHVLVQAYASLAFLMLAATRARVSTFLIKTCHNQIESSVSAISTRFRPFRFAR